MSTEFAKWSPVRAAPDSLETDTIIRAQSLLTRNGKVGPVLSYADALRIVETGQSQAAAPIPLSAAERDGTPAADAIRGHDPFDAALRDIERTPLVPETRETYEVGQP